MRYKEVFQTLKMRHNVAVLFRQAKWDNLKTSVLGHYSADYNYITLYIRGKRIANYKHAIITLAHELGHFKTWDYERADIEELKAWKWAKKELQAMNVWRGLASEFNRIKAECLKSYGIK